MSGFDTLKRIYSLFYILQVWILEFLSKKIEYFRYVKGTNEMRGYILKSFRKYLVLIHVRINLKGKDNFFENLLNGRWDGGNT